MRKSLLLVSLLTWTSHAVACDLCGCYTPQLDAAGPPHQSTTDSLFLNGVYVAVAEQFTHFGTVQVDGRVLDNPANQYLDSFITQLVAGYSVNSRFAVQVNVPLIYRSFSRPEGFAIDRGTEAGLGDVSLLGKLVLFHKTSGGGREVDFDDPQSPRLVRLEPAFTFSAILLGGIKFPTGDSSRIKEEFHEVEIEGAPPSGIHGHDLTLGTGSYDGIFGGQVSLRYKSFFFEQDLQFTLRGDGLHQYHFANELSWSGGPGYYFVRTPRVTVGLQNVLSGERKDVDRFRGKAAEDTGITSFFAGPRLVLAIGKISAEIAAELPLTIDNTALQIVPDYRISGALAIRF